MFNMHKIRSLSVESKFPIYKAAIKPIWTCGIELWVSVSKSDVVVMQRYHQNSYDPKSDTSYYGRTAAHFNFTHRLQNSVRK